ncbi:YqaJ viral recombinase family nuclease [Zobellella taiwanensis]|jgi:putative phage-type endonuclease|uniref:Endonuclease n=1 Tax=Zobellella taiwanensis TaxID=347535 RepID=A0A2P7R460_9GAMM|nr:YqaJ viral recombinase family protein [Zobellella taiwanensis]PSJ44975.1 endonuclease [Zobellella taiwanensis]
MKTRYSQALRLADTKALTHQQWLEVRQSGIGSSDAAVAIGLSPYKSPLSLWLEKTGRRPAPDLSNNEAVFWGTTLEPVLAYVYAQRTKLKVRRVNAVLQHPEHPFMLANLDREVLGHPDGVGTLEIKTAGYHSAPQWEQGIPLAYQCQVLHQLAVTGHAWADVAVLIAGQDFRIYRINRDDDKIADLIQRETVFWQHVVNDTQPEPDGSEDAGQALQSIYPEDKTPVLDLTESAEMNTLFCHFLSAKEKKEEAEAREARLKQQLQAALGDAGGAVFQEGKISWKRSRDRVVPDMEKLSHSHPEWLQQCSKTVPGSRRFTVQLQRSKS